MRLKEILDSGVSEMATENEEARRDSNGRLIQTYTDESFPEVGFSDSVCTYDHGNLWQFRALFYKGELVGTEVTYYPWNILQPIEMYFEVVVSPVFSFGDKVDGRNVEMSMAMWDDVDIIRLDEFDELVTFLKNWKYGKLVHDFLYD